MIVTCSPIDSELPRHDVWPYLQSHVCVLLQSGSQIQTKAVSCPVTSYYCTHGLILLD